MQFVLTNWYLFAALAVVLGLLAAGPVNRLIHGVKTLSPAQAVQLMNRESAVVVDVCEPNEYRNGHIPHALSAPLSGLKNHVKDLEKYRNRPLVVACRSGNRSLKGALILRRNGFSAVYALAGGLAAWERESLPVER